MRGGGLTDDSHLSSWNPNQCRCVFDHGRLTFHLFPDSELVSGPIFLQVKPRSVEEAVQFFATKPKPTLIFHNDAKFQTQAYINYSVPSFLILKQGAVVHPPLY